MSEKQSGFRHYAILFSLIFAGEMIFSLPFHVARFFRPTLLEAFNMNNTQLGDTFAIYGITAMLSYFPGGIIADYFPARKLLTFSLLTTALGGWFFAMLPSGTSLMLLFGYWGITTILFFWAGMIKATREWGGHLQQGRAFGLLDGGRGLVAAVMSTMAVALLSSQMDLEQSQSVHDAMIDIIQFYTFMTLLAGLLLWIFIPETAIDKTLKYHPFTGIKTTLGSQKVWLQAIIVICAYSGFKGADNYGLFAVKILHLDQVEAATFTSYAAYLRPVGAIAAGLLADKFRASRITLWSFVALTVFYIVAYFQQQIFNGSLLMMIAVFNLSLSFLAVFALRGIYFALVDESRIDFKITGTAVGIISFLGYTPDVFFASVTGRILDNPSSISGFENYFLLLMFIGLTGIAAAYLLVRQLNYHSRAEKL